MKLGFKYATQVWGYHIAAMLIGFFFIGNMSGSVFGMIVNAILVLGMIAMVLNNGAYLGEKACTLAASLEKQQAEGRKIDESLKTQVFDRKIAAWILIFGMLPFLLISTLNAVSQPFYQTGEVVQQSAPVEKESFSFDYGTDEEEEAVVQGTVNPFNLVARMTFMPYVTVYSLVNNKALNALFFLFSLLLPAAAAIGYLAGPAMRKKKLHDIALGKKRKMRGLKVNKKPKAPKAPKAEV